MKSICRGIGFLFISVLCLGAEMETFRLLSVSESEKIILVSSVPDKTKFLLDASSAKITIDGKPAEYKALKAFSIIQARIEKKKIRKEGIDLDGAAVEIRVDAEARPR